MKAQYTGICWGKGDNILPGEDIVRDGHRWSHPGHEKPVSPGAQLARDLRTRPARVTEPETEWARDIRLYKAAVEALSPSLREKWALVMRDNEYFDGEDAIALGTLRAMKADGRLARYVSRYPEY